MNIAKRQDWSVYFHEFIEANKDKKFKWGQWDCIKFTNSCFKSITGKNLLPNSWNWKTKKQALLAIENYGRGKGLAAAIDHAVSLVSGVHRVNINFIQKGDILVYKEETELAGIYDGFKILGPNSKEGLITKDPTSVKILGAWRADG